MAIKVGGTTVVDDSRQLTNIASVDATTVAALGAAGVGAGGGVFEATAGENIDAGNFVEIQSDGNAYKVKETTTPLSVADDSTYGGEYITASGSGGKVLRGHVVSTTSTYDSIMTFQKRNGRAYWSIHAVTEADPVQGYAALKTIGGYDLNNATSIYDPYNNVVVGIYDIYENDSIDWGTSAVATPNADGSDFTIGTSVKWLDNYRSDQFDAVYGANGVFFISYQSDAGGTHVIAGSVSGSTITYGSPHQWNANKRTTFAFYDSTNSQLGIITSGNETRFYSHSGTTLTAKSVIGSNNFSSSDATPRGAIFDSDNDVVIINYQDNVNGGTYVRAGSVSNNSVSWGTAQQLDNNSTFSVPTSFAILPDGRVAVAISSQSLGVTRLFLLSLSGTTITVGSYEQTSDAHDASGLVAHPDNNLLYLTGRNGSSSFIRGYETQTTTTNAGNRIGIASENIANGSSGDILVAGNTYSGYSGLTPGATYYLADDGTLATSGVAGRIVGRAISSTTLLIEG